MIRLISLLFLILSSTAYSANYPYDCSYTEYKDVPILTRIPDSQLPNSSKKAIWRPREFGSDECMVPFAPSYDYATKTLTYGNYFNNYSFTSWVDSLNLDPTSWGYIYEYDGKTARVGTHGFSCLQENSNVPSPYNTYQQMHTNIFVGIEYSKCYDKNGNTDKNMDGCYSISYETVEVTIPKTCERYICESTDPGYQDFSYTCAVHCVDFDRPAIYYRIKGNHWAYMCRYEPDIDDKEEEFCFTCLIENFTDSVLDALDTLHTQIQSIFDRFLNEEEPIDPEPIEPEDPEPQLDQVLLPVENNDFSVSKLIKNLFPTSSQCPTDSQLNILGANLSFSYSRICDALSYLGTLLMILSLYASYRIIRSA